MWQAEYFRYLAIPQAMIGTLYKECRIQQMYAQEECFTQRNYLKLTNMDETGCMDQNTCMITILSNIH